MIVGAFLPHREAGRWSPASMAAILARKSARYDHQKIFPVFDDPHFAMALVVAHERRLGENLLRNTSDDANPSWAYFHKVRPDNPGEVLTALGKCKWDAPPSMSGLWTAVQWNSTGGRLRIATDPLGCSMLFIAPFDGGFIFSPDFGAVAELCDRPLHFDLDSVLLQFAYGYSPDNSTVFREISVVPPRALVELGSDGVKTIGKGHFAYGDRYFGATEAQKFEALDEILGKVSAHWFRDDEEIVVSLSAGYDSRYALALLHARHKSPRLFTFGAADSLEVVGAMEVARRIDATTEVFGAAASSKWDSWMRCTSELGTLAMNQWAGWGEDWLHLLRRHGTAVAIGYLGDALTGKHLGNNPSQVTDWIGHWIDWSTDEGRLNTRLITDQGTRRLRRLARERFGALADGIAAAHPFQTLLHLDLFGRQRRQVSNQPSLIERFATPLIYFGDARYIDFWCNVPLNDLVDQRLYLEYAANRFSALFPRQRFESTIKKMASRIIRKANSVISPQKPRPSAIEHDRIVLQNREQILSFAEGAPQDLNEVVALDRFKSMVRNYGAPGSVSQENSQAIISVSSLLQLASVSRHAQSIPEGSGP